MRSVLIIAALLCPLLARLQDRPSYRVNPGEKPTEVLPDSALYCFPEFRPGVVHFRNGNTGRSRMNYSNFFGEMQFIQGSDTMSLIQGEETKFVSFEKDTFYFSKGWLRQLASAGKVKLLEKKLLAFGNRERIGPYGGISRGSVESVQSLDIESNPLAKLYVAKEILTFIEQTQYFILDSYGSIRQAGKKTVADMFSRSHPGIDQYLSTNRIDYTRQADMLMLFRYLFPEANVIQ